MTLPKPLRMSTDEFISWAMEQDGRYELASGEVVAVAPKRAAHNLVKSEARESLPPPDHPTWTTAEILADGGPEARFRMGRGGSIARRRLGRRSASSVDPADDIRRQSPRKPS